MNESKPSLGVFLIYGNNRFFILYVRIKCSFCRRKQWCNYILAVGRGSEIMMILRFATVVICMLMHYQAIALVICCVKRPATWLFVL